MPWCNPTAIGLLGDCCAGGPVTCEASTVTSWLRTQGFFIHTATNIISYSCEMYTSVQSIWTPIVGNGFDQTTFYEFPSGSLRVINNSGTPVLMNVDWSEVQSIGVIAGGQPGVDIIKIILKTGSIYQSVLSGKTNALNLRQTLNAMSASVDYASLPTNSQNKSVYYDTATNTFTVAQGSGAAVLEDFLVGAQLTSNNFRLGLYQGAIAASSRCTFPGGSQTPHVGYEAWSRVVPFGEPGPIMGADINGSHTGIHLRLNGFRAPPSYPLLGEGMYCAAMSTSKFNVTAGSIITSTSPGFMVKQGICSNPTAFQCGIVSSAPMAPPSGIFVLSPADLGIAGDGWSHITCV